MNRTRSVNAAHKAYDAAWRAVQLARENLRRGRPGAKEALATAEALLVQRSGQLQECELAREESEP